MWLGRTRNVLNVVVEKVPSMSWGEQTLRAKRRKERRRRYRWCVRGLETRLGTLSQPGSCRFR